MPTTLTDSNFASEVTNSKLPVIIDFWAEWCGPCKMMGPVFEELSHEYEGRLKFAKLNVDENYRLAEKFGVRSIPTLIVLKGEKEIESIIGFYPKPALKERIDSILKSIK